MKFVNRMGFIATAMFLLFFTTCEYGRLDRALIDSWLPEGAGSAPGNFPDKLELSKDGTGESDGRNVMWKSRNGNLVIDISKWSFLYYYEVSDSKLTLTAGGRSVTYITAEEAHARKEERAGKEEELRKKEEAAADLAWKEAGVSFDTDMIFAEGGTFMMGCTPEQQDDCFDSEKPAHEVTLSDFYIGKYEVTQLQWRAVMGNNPSHFEGGNLPVENVSWDDVEEFISRLNERTGENYRLPTEAEWEYAARGGSRSSGYKYSGSNDIGDVAWFFNNSDGATHPVGAKIANELGIYDMSGNVWEWVSDWYGNYNDGMQMDPKGPAEGTERVFRGGGWVGGGMHYAAMEARVLRRSAIDAWFRSGNIGFRLVRSPKQGGGAPLNGN